MAKKNNKVCICCSKEYSYCNRCKDFILYPTWMNIFHDKNCREIFNTASAYLACEITKEEAKARFDACDLSNINSLKSKIVETINEVCKVEDEEKVNDITEEKAEDIVENTQEEEIVGDDSSFEKIKYNKKK